jgi:FAD/FMN-containing dehydrogenase
MPKLKHEKLKNGAGYDDTLIHVGDSGTDAIYTS